TKKSGGIHIRWNDTRIERVIDWLEINVDDRHKLFSDSLKDTAEEQRKKHVAKGSKFVYYTAIAKAVFRVNDDEKIRDACKEKLEDLAKSTENVITRLKSTYKEFNTELGQTGAGLDYDQIDVGSDIYNKIDELNEKYKLPYWERLHGFWRTLPNFNPTVKMAEPGQDIAAEALKLTHHHVKHTEDEDDVISNWSRVSGQPLLFYSSLLTDFPLY
ncbi:hypothetical protein C8R46DRAFT_902539, partial [Mycena filopes]